MFVGTYANCRRLALLAVLCVGVAAIAQGGENAGKSSVGTGTPTTASIQFPAYFEGNEGQFPAAVNFVARMSGYTAWFTSKELILNAGDPKHRANVRMQLVGSSGELVGIDRLPGKVNYFVGSDPTKWHRGVPLYDRIMRQRAYPGIDLVYRVDGTELEYDLVVAPGANPNRIDLQFDGAKRVRIDSAGDLVFSTAVGDIRQRKPTVYQDSSSGRKALDGHFVLEGHDRVGFKLAAYDPSKGLVIDPSIIYSTYLGGTTGSVGNSVAMFTDQRTGQTYAYVTGDTRDNNFPVTPNAQQQALGAGCTGCAFALNVGDGFVAKLDPTASGSSSLVYSTYFGGDRGEHATGIAVDSAGNAYVTGATSSPTFPVVNAYQSTIKFGPLCQSFCASGTLDSFLTKLSSDGSALLYSTYFGGSGADIAGAIALDSAGHAYIAGSTSSSDLPLVNPFQSSPTNGFLAVFDTAASGSSSLLYSTYIGGSACGCNIFLNYLHRTGPGAFAVAVDAANTVHVGGKTGPGLAVVNGFQSGILGSGVSAAFYARLNPWTNSSAQLLYSTYLGDDSTSVSGVAVDSSGGAYLTGQVLATAVFPTTSGSYQPVVPSNFPAWFAAKINPSLVGSASLVYSTILPVSGTGAMTDPPAIAVDGSGDAFFVATYNAALPLINSTEASVDGVLQSVDGGLTWTNPSNSLTDFPITALAVDASTSPRTLYAGTEIGSIFASSDGGLNWNRVFQIQPGASRCNTIASAISTTCVFAITVDPTTPSTVYAGTSSGLYKTTNRGSTWTTFNTGFVSSSESVNDLVFDADTLYAGTADGLYKLTVGTATWILTAFTGDVHHIAIAPPDTIYTTVDGFPDNETSPSILLQKSMDGGKTWTNIQAPGQCGGFNLVAVDTSITPAELYGSDPCASYGGASFWVSTDGGNTWSTTQTDPYSGLAGTNEILKVDSATSPSTIYFASPTISGFWISKDHGNHWIPTWNEEQGGFGAITIDPSTATATSPSVVYAGTGPFAQRGFVAELNPAGSALLFSTYVGGVLGVTFGNAIALDNSGNIYVTGATDSRFFPVVNGYESFPVPANVSAPTLAFLMKLGSQTLPQSSSSTVSTQVGVQTGTLTVTLPNIQGSTTTSAPTLTVNPLSSAQTANFSLSNNLGAYDISTTASFSGSVTLCFQALIVNDPTTFSNLELFHIVNGAAVNVTSSYDFSTRTVCGTVTSLSPFVLFSPTTSTALTSSLRPSTFGQSVTFTATVAASGGTPTGTVTFYDGALSLGTGTLNSSGQATLSVSSLSAGTHAITAVYGGNAPLLGSTSAALMETVNKAPTATAISTTAAPSIDNQSVTFTARLSVVAPGSGMPTGTVTFKDGSVTLGTGTSSSGTATFTTSLLAVGSHSITAVYGGDSNFAGSTSAPLTQQVEYEPAGTTCLGAAGHQILQPVNSDGTSVWKQGRTIPAQFRVCDANGVAIGTAGVVSKFSLTKVVSGTVTSVDETVSSTTSDTAFRWDANNQQWVFNISTTSLAAGNTYVYTITLNDGTAIGFQYGLK